MLIKLGTKSIGGQPYLIDPTRHINIIGASGVGKSSLLETIFTSFCREHGGLFCDPHGDVADRLPLLLPKHRRRDIIFLDPDSSAVPQFNPLSFSTTEELELAKETCLTILKALSGSDSAWGNQTPYIVRNALDAITEFVPHPTLVHLMLFLASKKYRVKLLKKSKDPFVRLFAEQELSDDAFNPAINKVAKLMRSHILSCIGWPHSLDLLDCMNTGKIIICRLSKGRLGDESAQILYSLIISMFSIAALKREKQSVRPQFLIVADEAQNAIHGGRFGTLLAEARKYGLSLCTAFQGFYQVPFSDDVLTNAATQIVFNPSGEDAITMAKNWNDPNVQPINITELSRYEFYARTFSKDNVPAVQHVQSPPPLQVRFKNDKTRQATFEKILRQSEMRWGVRRSDIADEVSKIFS